MLNDTYIQSSSTAAGASYNYEFSLGHNQYVKSTEKYLRENKIYFRTIPITKDSKLLATKFIIY